MNSEIVNIHNAAIDSSRGENVSSPSEDRFMWGWYPTDEKWVKVQVDTDGKVVVTV